MGLANEDPQLFELIKKEEHRIEFTLDLIAAENHLPKSIMEAEGSIFNTKTIEGYPSKRFHAGCEYADQVENLARERGRELFKADHINVQPHSGTSANLAVYFSVLKTGDTVLAMSLPHGGHLSHGHQASITSQCFNFHHYSVNPVTECIDYQQIADLADQHHPRMIVAGASSYPRLIDYAKIAEIAQIHNAYFLADIAHLAGLVAAEVIPSPIPVCDFVTFTCYKTMGGCRGGVILCKKDHATKIDRSIFPGCQGTSAVNLIAAKALSFKKAMQPEFKELQNQTLKNAIFLAEALVEKGFRVVSGGTENHQVIIDLSDKKTDGLLAEKTLESIGIVTNRNVIPKDAGITGQISGIRLGSAAVTIRKMNKPEMIKIAKLIYQALNAADNSLRLLELKREVESICREFPVYNDNFESS